MSGKSVRFTHLMREIFPVFPGGWFRVSVGGFTLQVLFVDLLLFIYNFEN